ncbi:MAG: pantoate--beta-alanine ligase [Opitutae bacterium]|jgi:pantoate--beta-alanine ligase|nr:pantoate--beta-alanine ligase [Opitutae bacterium]
MQVIESIEEMQTVAMQLRFGGHLIGLVPTMGNLHDGHISLIKQAKEKSDKVIVTIFVNPKQFGPSEDFAEYPRTWKEDLKKCEDNGVDIIFHPSAEAMFPKDFSTYLNEETVSEVMCGISRPSHFKGVTTVCLKLFNLVRPDFSFFGQKDAQQCAVIKKIVRDLNIPTEIKIGETIREPDGLALSSRNQYLTKLQREDALSISKALTKAKDLVDSGIKSTDRIIAEIIHMLSQKRRIRIIYVQVVDRETMQAAKTVLQNQTIACVAVWVDDVRLIDNIVF